MAALILFIGGCMDGVRVRVPEDAVQFRVPLPGKEFSHTQDYRKERLATRDRFFEYFVLESIPTEVAIEKLFDHYRPK